MLRVENLCQGKTLRDITFSLRGGEIVGLFGLMGAGSSELARAIYGVDPIDSGTIRLKGSTRQRARRRSGGSRMAWPTSPRTGARKAS